MSEAEALDVGGERGSKLAIGQRAVALIGHPAPGAGVDFVNGDRSAEGIARATRGHPGAVGPGVLALPGDRTCMWRKLCSEGEGVGLVDAVAVVAGRDVEFVDVAASNAGDETFPYTGGCDRE